MDEAERLIAAFRARPGRSVVARLDALMDLERLRDPKVVPFLLDVLADRREPPEVRMHVLWRVRMGHLTPPLREAVARVILQIISEGSAADLRERAALALADFTDIDRVVEVLGHLVLTSDEPINIRYSAFTSLQRAGPTAECVALLRQLATDGALGLSARGVLSSWGVS